MVADADLNTFGSSGTSADVSTPLDRSLLLHFRRNSDLVVTDAATAELEQYKQSKFADIEIWTKSGNSRGLVSMPASDGLNAMTVVHVENASRHLTNLLTMRQSILLETGKTLSKVLARDGIIDEACLTITRASDKSLALQKLRLLSSALGLTYLNETSHLWLEQTLFARIKR